MDHKGIVVSVALVRVGSNQWESGGWVDGDWKLEGGGVMLVLLW